MIFVDTSALYAILDRDDQAHQAAESVWSELLTTTNGTTLITSNDVLVESFALIQARLGIAAVRTFHDDILPVFHAEWVTPTKHRVAAQAPPA
jgi:predicted nucleic acid-binding protein